MIHAFGANIGYRLFCRARLCKRIQYISSAGALLEALRLCWPAAQHRIAPWKIERPLAAVPPLGRGYTV